MRRLFIGRTEGKRITRLEEMKAVFTIKDRAENYHNAFPDFPELRIFNDRIEDLWFLGNDYSNGSSYYGAYPKSYLKRMKVLFTERPLLHLFSGEIRGPMEESWTFDIREESKADWIGDAEKLSQHINTMRFRLIFADPPYSQEDAEHYGTTLIKRNTVIAECHKILHPGGFLVWLDQVFPMFSKKNWHLAGMIGIVISTNHRFRCATILQKI